MFTQLSSTIGNHRVAPRGDRHTLPRIGFAFGLAVLIPLFILGHASMAQGGPIVQHTDPYWRATYWNNTSLSGTPALERQESDLNHDWGNGSPDGAVSADHFSARWTRYIDVTPGTHRFTAISDDGIRVWVDGALIVDQWHDHPATTYTVDRYLNAGHHLVTVEYYENAGQAVAKLHWTLVSGGGYYWRGEYYNNMSLSGSPSMVRDDAEINFNWGEGSPASGQINADVFSVRWTRNIDLAAGTYQFAMTVDDGGRLYVNGHLLIDAWKDQPATTYTGDIYLPGGSITAQMEYYENHGLASARLSWGGGGAPPTPPGGVLVDDTSPGFSKGGSASGWRTEGEGHGGRLTWTWNNDYARSNYNWARWYPYLAAGRYEVFVYIPYRFTTTSQARYWVSHRHGYTLKVVNQSTNGDRWISLGTYWFRGTGDDYVSLSDVTYEPYRSRLVAFDAVNWEPR
jgi:hypothetical protein